MIKPQDCFFVYTNSDCFLNNLQKAFRSLELDENSVTRKFRVTASDGKNYDTKHYNLKAIIAVGNKDDSPKAVQFRKWVNNIIEEYTIKGFANGIDTFEALVRLTSGNPFTLKEVLGEA